MQLPIQVYTHQTGPGPGTLPLIYGTVVGGTLVGDKPTTKCLLCAFAWVRWQRDIHMAHQCTNPTDVLTKGGSDYKANPAYTQSLSNFTIDTVSNTLTQSAPNQ